MGIIMAGMIFSLMIVFFVIGTIIFLVLKSCDVELTKDELCEILNSYPEGRVIKISLRSVSFGKRKDRGRSPRDNIL